MKIMISVLGILIILAGVIPFFSASEKLFGVIPTQGAGYAFVVLTIGILGLIYGVMNSMLFGVEKFVTIAIAILTILGGLIPFLQNFLPAIIPTSGPLYSITIIIIGAIGLVYGFIAIG